LEQYPDAFTTATVIFVEGELQKRDETAPMQLIAKRVIPMAAAKETLATEVHIRLHEKDMTDEKLEELKRIVLDYPGETELFFCLVCADGNVVYVQNERLSIRFTPDFEQRIQACLGTEDAILLKPNHKRPAAIKRYYPRFNRED